MVDLGLLKALHSYEVHFNLPHNLGKDLQIPNLQSPLVEIKQLCHLDSGDGHQVLLEVKCPESSVLKEKICFENADKETICLTLTCRVIPHHLGTPSLKDGVRLIHGSGGDMESDATDWKGFDE